LFVVAVASTIASASTPRVVRSRHAAGHPYPRRASRGHAVRSGCEISLRALTLAFASAQPNRIAVCNFSSEAPSSRSLDVARVKDARLRCHRPEGDRTLRIDALQRISANVVHRRKTRFLQSCSRGCLGDARQAKPTRFAAGAAHGRTLDRLHVDSPRRFVSLLDVCRSCASFAARTDPRVPSDAGPQHDSLASCTGRETSAHQIFELRSQVNVIVMAHLQRVPMLRIDVWHDCQCLMPLAMVQAATCYWSANTSTGGTIRMAASEARGLTDLSPVHVL